MPSSRPSRLGKYDLMARIAKGGMAEIYLARQRGMVGFSRLVVVKRILPHLAEETEFVRMFMEEARLAALINQPNVVQIYDVGHHEGSYFIAMEFINGPSLGVVSRTARRLKHPLPFAVAAEIVAQACDGLHAAHELHDEGGSLLGLVHRDISPHNLMITKGGVVKLVDFGIAKAVNTAVKTHTGKIKGKYPYMSPEQCRGDPMDRRTDLFSLGIVFYELVVGARLFSRSTDLMVLKAITEEPVPDPREREPSIPAGISALILRALARDPDARFPTAEAMGSALRRALERLEVKSSPKMLSSHLEAHFGELLGRRAEAIQQVLELKPGEPPPLVDGLDEGSVGSTAGPTADLSRSIAPLPTGGSLRIVKHRPLRRWLLAALVVIGLAAGAGVLYRHLRTPARPSGKPLYLGLPPSFPAAVSQRELRPVLRYLERRLNRPVDLVITKNYDNLRKRVLSGELQMGNLPALQFVLARHQSPNLRALVTHTIEGALSYQSYLITRDDSDIRDLQQLKGKRFCYSDKGSTSGYLLPRYYLRRNKLDPEQLFSEVHYSGDHLSVMKDVIKGRCDAGAVYSVAMLGARNLGIANSRLRVLAVAGQIPYDIICVPPQVDAKLAAAIGRALLELQPQRDLGRRSVGPTFRIDGFVKPRLADFALVERAARAEGLIK
jgi:eukaryotic-like serine/threonine-protein kinase